MLDMVQLNLKFTHACWHTHMLVHLICAKVQNLACACTVAGNFGMHTQAGEHTWHMRDGHHKLTHLVFHSTSIDTDTVAIGNEM